VQVADADLQALTQESLESERGIQALEIAATSLYKALQAGRDASEYILLLRTNLEIDRQHAGDMAATMERLKEYETRNRQFCLRVIEYLFIMFKFQVSDSWHPPAKLPADTSAHLAGGSRCDPGSEDTRCHDWRYDNAS
jgi:exocyst complex component 1